MGKIGFLYLGLVVSLLQTLSLKHIGLLPAALGAFGTGLITMSLSNILNNLSNFQHVYCWGTWVLRRDLEQFSACQAAYEVPGEDRGILEQQEQ